MINIKKNVYYLIVNKSNLYLLYKESNCKLILDGKGLNSLKNGYCLISIEGFLIDLILLISSNKIKARFLPPLISSETYKSIYNLSNINYEILKNTKTIKYQYFNLFESIIAEKEHICPNYYANKYTTYPLAIDKEYSKNMIEDYSNCNDVLKNNNLYLENNKIRDTLSLILLNSIDEIKEEEKEKITEMTIQEIKEKNEKFFDTVINRFIQKAKYSYTNKEINKYLQSENLM